MKKSDRFWNKIAANYDTTSKARFAQLYQDTIEHARKYLKPSDTALDFACGTGLTTIPLAASVLKIFAIDVSEEMIAIARKKSQRQGVVNVEFSVADLYTKNLDEGSLDVVMAFNILHFLPDIHLALKRIHALLKPSGLFLSATDCYAENRSLLTVIQPLASILGAFPNLRQYKFLALEKLIRAEDFDVLETRVLYLPPDRMTMPNFFIAALKGKLPSR